METLHESARRHTMAETSTNKQQFEDEMNKDEARINLPGYLQTSDRRSSAYNLLKQIPSSQQRRLSLAPPMTRTRKFSLFSFNQPLYIGMGSGKSKIQYENTYRIDEHHDEKFKPRIIYEATQQVVEDILDSCNYVGKIDSKKTSLKNWSCDMDGGGLAKLLVKDVQKKLKMLGMNRHKFVVNAVIGERKGQGMMIASRCLWDDVRDGYVTVESKNSKIYAIVVVHAIHYE